MRITVRLVALGFGVVLEACGGDDAPRGSALGPDGGAGGGGSVVSIGAGCEPDGLARDGRSRAHSEGSEAAPVEVPFDRLPFAGGVRNSEGPSFYRITGLDTGARYVVDVQQGFNIGYTRLFQLGFSGVPICEQDWTRRVGCLAVVQGTSLDLMMDPIDSDRDGECFTFAATLDSPAGAFEGATDDLMTLRYGTTDLPHRGIVDHERSYYRISQLSAGRRYRVVLSGRDDAVELVVGKEDPEGGIINAGCLLEADPSTGDVDRFCTVVAEADTLGAEIWHYGSVVSSKYLLSVYEDLESEGSAGAPVVIPYAGGVTYRGQVARATGTLEPGRSYYEVTGVTPGQQYLVGTTEAAAARALVHEDRTFATAVACGNTPLVGPQAACIVAARSASLFVGVQGHGEHFSRFTLSVHAAPSDEGTSAAPLPLAYPGAFPYSGEVDWNSEYLVSALPSGLLTVTLAARDGPAGLSAWPADAGGILCMVGDAFPRCTLRASAAGELRMRVNGPAHFDIDIAPAPFLTSQHTSVPAGGTPIPNGDSMGITDDLDVTSASVGAIERLTVELFIEHGRPVEVEAFLVGPNGREVKLVQKAGGPYEGVVVDDYALGDYDGRLEPLSFTQRPVDPLHAFEGTDPVGTWSLRVVDNEDPNIQGNDGVLLGWGLSFEPR
jgi:hypothetical protein